MFMICWTNRNEKTWEIIEGEDAMQVFVSELIDNGTDESGIMVFNLEDELDNKEHENY